MRGAAMVLAILAFGLVAGRAAAASDRGWVVMSGGGLGGGGNDRLYGWCAAVAALKPIRPWFLLGSEAAWHEFPAGRTTTDFFSERFHRSSRAITGVVASRLQSPVSGLSPFVLAEAGLGLRVAMRRPWPDIDANIRAASWTTARIVFSSRRPTETLGAMRLTCAW